MNSDFTSFHEQITMKEKVAILGASNNPERYSYLALNKLLENGHQPFLVSPKYQEIDGHKVYKNLSQIEEQIDTITIYVNPNISTDLCDF